MSKTNLLVSMASNETEVDYQLGSHKLDTSGSIVDDDDVIEFDFESGAVFRRLADDIYESPEAGIREPLTNAITTVRRVFGNSDEGVIKITVQDGDQVMLRLRDNGEGITKAVLKQVLTVIGRSNARDDGKLSGQYGMGFLASYKLVGLDGGFLMCTNPRETNEGPYSGLFKPGTYEPDNNNSLPQLLDEDEYGTAFEYYVRDDVSVSDIRDWVEEHAKWSPVPVIYKELDEDGTEVYNEDYHAEDLTDAYGDMPSLHVENEYYEAATSPNAESDIVLISSPVSMSGTRSLRSSLPWSVDLRLKYENGVIFKGPNEGRVPTNERHYESLSEERKKKYIKEEDVEAEDMQLPEPTGTRERMRRHRDFLNHVNDQLHNQYIDEVEETLEKFDPDTMSMQDLDSMGRHVMLRIFTNFDDESKDYTQDEIENKLSKQYSYDSPDDSLLEFIQAMTRNVVLVSEQKNYDNTYPRKPAYQLVNDEERVFMCVSQNSWKKDAVSRADEETYVVKVDNSDEYDPFEEHLGWTKLKAVKKRNATDMLELTDDELEQVTSTKSSKADDISERKVTVHYSGGGRTTIKREADRLVEMFENNTQGSRMGDVLVLFSRTGDANISDNYSLANRRCSLASCGKKMKEFLTEGAEDIITYDEYAEWAGEASVITSSGYKKAKDVFQSPSNKVVNVVKNVESQYTESVILNTIEEELQSKSKVPDDAELVFVNKQDWHHLLNNEDEYSLSSCQTIGRSNTYTSRNTPTDTIRYNLYEVFAKGYLDNQIHETSEFLSIIDQNNSLSKDLFVSCKLLEQIHENPDSSFASLEESETEVVLPKHDTKNGRMDINEVYEEYEPRQVVVHKLTGERMDTFTKNEILENASEAVSGLEFSRYDIPELGNETIYVPIHESDFQQVEEYIKKGTTILGGWSTLRDDRKIDIEPKYVYGAVMLQKWSTNQIEDLVSGAGFENAKNLIDSVQQIHDSSSVTYSTDEEKVLESL